MDELKIGLHYLDYVFEPQANNQHLHPPSFSYSPPPLGDFINQEQKLAIIIESVGWATTNKEGCNNLEIGANKNKLIPTREVPNMEEPALMLGCRVGKLPITYLGLPLGASFKS